MQNTIFSERRLRAQRALEGGVLVLAAAPSQIRNNDVHHAYRQDSDLYYLTGFEEPDSVLVLSSLPAPKLTLFVRPRDAEREVWDGARAGLEGAKANYGADEAFPIAELSQRLPELLLGHNRLHYHIGRYPNFDEQLLRALSAARQKGRRGQDYPIEIIDSDVTVHEFRRLKNAEELELMAKAIAITHEAHTAAMREARSGMHEYELEAILRNTFLRLGSPRVAYEPIVGSGPNATVLHHIKNDRRFEAGELILIDAGAEYGYYAADITRTFPVGGKFSAAQRAVYELVLRAQEAAISETGPGATLDGIHDATVRELTAGLIELGIIAGPLAKAIEEKRYQRYYMHRTSHYLGMDVHDVGRYYTSGQPRPLEPGVVITIEPGLYVSERDEGVPLEFRGIGVRIEDDVLVTASGRTVLSSMIPKTVADVEQACG